MAVELIANNYTTGSEEPELRDSVPRFIAFQFCPYCERVALIIVAKQIECDKVYVNLQAKPEWVFSTNEAGKVPVFQTDGKTVVDSMLICDYIDDTVDGKELYPSDAYEKYEQRLFLDTISPFFAAHFLFIYKDGDFIGIEKGLDLIENRLSKQGKQFIGGDEPMMVDYMLWPWLERLPALLSIRLNVKDWKSQIGARHPLTAAYMEAMLNDDAVKSVAYDSNIHEEFYLYYKSKM